MTYQVLARKWRPQTFSALVGQEHVVQALSNAFDTKRIHQAYLFTGTRGVGKTTLARIIAKALNCEQGVTSKPCLSCDACCAIESGSFIDLIEIDAASRTKVEDTREMLDNVMYRPTVGRYKVYLIDEVHMLSGHSFNALLKTLEEPPPHVVFILATTDAHKIPMTVLSRCLKFTLKHLLVSQIVEHLKTVCDKEHVAFDETSLVLLATAAAGSMRDALSLLDQAIAYCPKGLNAQSIRQMFGFADDAVTKKLLYLLYANEGNGLLDLVERIALEGVDFESLLDDVIDNLYQISKLQCVDSSKCSLKDERLYELAKLFEPTEIQLYYDIAVKGRAEMGMLPNLKRSFSMLMLRMLAFHPDSDIAHEQKMSALSSGKEKDSSASITVTKEHTRLLEQEIEKPPGVKVDVVMQPKAQEIMPEESRHELKTLTADDWHHIVTSLNLSGMAKTVFNHSVVLEHTEDSVTLGLENTYETFLTKPIKERLIKALSDYYKRPIKLHFNTQKKADSKTPAQITDNHKKQQVEAVKSSLEHDETLQDIIKTFDATIDESSLILTEDEP